MTDVRHIPSPSQRAAIEAGPGPVLVLAGPGAGKTFCLIERIRYLIEEMAFDPARICAFTFTNKAADEIASRLTRQLGARAEQVKRGTLHAFCADLLREFGAHVGIGAGFGIADEDYQKAVLRRVGAQGRWLDATIKRFTSHRFRGEALHSKDAALFHRYEQFLERRNVADFDMLVLKAAELLTKTPAAAELRQRWDYVLVDEFQDLNPFQYAIVRELAATHRNLFAVGDDEQSIYSWVGAEPKLFRTFANDFTMTKKVDLQENHRCPREVVALGRRLIVLNPPVHSDRAHAEPTRASGFPVAAYTFADDDAELAWVMDDLRRDREAHGLEWGDYALLYRTNEIGAAIEVGLLGEGIPCRMARGRALADDPIVGYVIASLRVIAAPNDEVHHEGFLAGVLPKRLLADVRVRAEEQQRSVLDTLDDVTRDLPKEHGDVKKIRRGFYALQNLAAIGSKHETLTSLVEELLSQRVGEYRSVLEERHDELSDPAANADVVRLAARLSDAVKARRAIWLPTLGGVGIALKGLLQRADVRRVEIGGAPPAGAEEIRPEDVPSVGLALGLFKAAQLMRTRSITNTFRDFTTVDLETTDKDITTAEIVELAAVRVRDGVRVGEFHSLVRPRVPIAPGANRAHGLTEAALADAPYFEDVWPAFRAFCGNDVLVAHNGYAFDFPLLRRMAAAQPGTADLMTYDTLPLARELHPASRKLPDLARAYGVDTGTSHRALDDTRALAGVFLALSEAKVVRARKTTGVDLLEYLGVALALGDAESVSPEAKQLLKLSIPFALGRYGTCLDVYRAERDRLGDPSTATTESVIERLGGEEVMQRIRAERTADQRYPVAMFRLRRLLDQCGDGPLAAQLETFLERAALSQWDGADPEKARVNLLTLHSTKGLEFSRIYIMGVEDAHLPGGTATRVATDAEIQESRRLLYVGMTRAQDRLVLTHTESRLGKPGGGHRFLDEMGLTPSSPA